MSSVVTLSAKTSLAFFEAVTRTLLRVGREIGVPHHVALSIVGIDGIDEGYYAGKLAQERIIAAQGGGWSVLRATQFHEFAEQTLARGSFGPLTMIPEASVRPVAAREVAAALVDVAEAGPSGRVPDLAGPRDEHLVDVVRRMLRHDGAGRPVIGLALPGRYWKALRSGALRGAADARRGTITFDAWLDSADHRHD